MQPGEINESIETYVSNLSDEEVQSNLAYLAKGQYSERFIASWQHFTMDFCHDRFRCKTIGADYARMNPDDVSRVKLYAYYFMRHKR